MAAKEEQTVDQATKSDITSSSSSASLSFPSLLHPKKLVHRAAITSFYNPYKFFQLSMRVSGWKETLGGKFLYVNLAEQTKQVASRDQCPQPPATVRVVCLSDTHETHDYVDVPEGDVLLHCGDINFQDRTEWGSIGRLQAFNSFLGSLPHRHKVVIAGNHDQILMDLGQTEAQRILSNAVYLEDSETTLTDLGGIRIYGSPTSPRGSSGNKAFQKSSQRALKEVWSQIPEGIDILMTHGSESNLFQEIKKKKPAVHVSGHFHMHHGAYFQWDTVFINASILDNRYFPTHLPVVFDYPVAISADPSQ